MNVLYNALVLSFLVASQMHAFTPLTRDQLKNIPVQFPVTSGYFTKTTSLQNKTAYDLIGSSPYSKELPSYWQKGPKNLAKYDMALVLEKGKYTYGVILDKTGSMGGTVYYDVQTTKDAAERNIKKYSQDQVAAFIPSMYQG